MRFEVLVVGAGTMGTAIADTFAAVGIHTALMSRNPERGITASKNVALVSAYPAEPPALVIEAIPEDAALKIDLFQRVEAAYGGIPVLASNSSGLPLQDIAAELRHPDHFLGIHYFHPARELPLVEIVRVAETTDESLAIARGLLARSGRDAVVLARPVPGALINRLQHALLHEAYHLMAEGLATPADIDNAARWLLGPRMSISGLLEQKDLSGLEGHAKAQRTIVPDLCHDPHPNPIVQTMLANGHTGAKAGRGFYDWSERDPDAAATAAAKRLRDLLAYLGKDAR